MYKTVTPRKFPANRCLDLNTIFHNTKLPLYLSLFTPVPFLVNYLSVYANRTQANLVIMTFHCGIFVIVHLIVLTHIYKAPYYPNHFPHSKSLGPPCAGSSTASVSSLPPSIDGIAAV